MECGLGEEYAAKMEKIIIEEKTFLKKVQEMMLFFNAGCLKIKKIICRRLRGYEMENIYFLHKKHISVTPYLVFTYIIACVLVFAVMMRGWNAVAIGILSTLTLITAVLVKYDKSI